MVAIAPGGGYRPSEDSIGGEDRGRGWSLSCGRSQPSHGVAGHRGARPLEAVPGDQHVPDQGLDGRLPHQPDEEELLDDGGGDGAEGGEAEEELAEPGGLVGVLGAAVLLQGALRLLLQLLHHGGVGQTTGIWRWR